MSERETKTIMIYDSERYGGNALWPPRNLAEFVTWASQKLTEIPEQYRSQAAIEIDARLDYDDAEARIEITYKRPETDDERRTRLADEANRQHARSFEERQLYENLKAKFEPS